MKKLLISLALTLVLFTGLVLFATPEAFAADDPILMRVEASETNGLPAETVIKLFVSSKSNNTYTCGIYLPGNAVPGECRLSWDGTMQVTYGGTQYDSGTCPIPGVGEQKEYKFKKGNTDYTYKITTYKGSDDVNVLFIDIDESQGTIQAMDGDETHETICVGRINIDGTWYEEPDNAGYTQAMENGAKRNILCDPKNPKKFRYEDEVQRNIRITGALIAMALIFAGRFLYSYLK